MEENKAEEKKMEDKNIGEEKLGEKKWTEISISGELWVSDFGRIHCTDSFAVSYPREQVVPDAFLDTPRYYHGVKIHELDGEDVIASIGGTTYRLTPGTPVDGPTHPLDYAWSTIRVSLI